MMDYVQKKISRNTYSSLPGFQEHGFCGVSIELACFLQVVHVLEVPEN